MLRAWWVAATRRIPSGWVKEHEEPRFAVATGDVLGRQGDIRITRGFRWFWSHGLSHYLQGFIPLFIPLCPICSHYLQGFIPWFFPLFSHCLRVSTLRDYGKYHYWIHYCQQVNHNYFFNGQFQWQRLRLVYWRLHCVFLKWTVYIQRLHCNRGWRIYRECSLAVGP